MDIYDRIDKLLDSKNLSRRKLALLAGIPPTTLQSAFSRKTENLSMESIKKIADVLDVTPVDLMGVEYWDRIFGEEYTERLSKSVNLIYQLEKLYGKVVADATAKLIDLSSDGQQQAYQYISELYDIKKE